MTAFVYYTLAILCLACSNYEARTRKNEEDWNTLLNVLILLGMGIAWLVFFFREIF